MAGVVEFSNEDVRDDRHNQRRTETLQETDHARDDDHMERISIEAFFEGQRLRPVQKEWDEYIFPEYLDDDMALMPIEVVSGEPDPKVILQLDISRTRTTRSDPTKRARIEKAPAIIDNRERSVVQPLPERIRIISKPLIIIFDELDSKSRLGLRIPPPTDSVVDATVFLRPYQELFYREQQLREWLTTLEKRFETYERPERSPSTPPWTQRDHYTEQERAHGSVTLPAPLYQEASIDQIDRAEKGSIGSSAPTGGYEHVTTGNNDERNNSRTYSLSHSISALLHLRCLMDFIDTELKPKQEYISSSKCTRIYFHDLWHLFKPGDEVIQQDGKQALVVLRVQVPRHRIEDPYHLWQRMAADDASYSDDDIENEKVEHDDGSFMVHCAFIDFDGKRFGPVSKTFKVLPFDETRLIETLPVYPLRCCKDFQARQNLINGGRMLLKVSSVTMMHYEGVTLDRREAIDSQVVIDYDEVFADKIRRDTWKPKIRNLDISGDRLGLPCNSICCDYQNVHDGFEIDSKMTEDHIMSLFPDMSKREPSIILQPRSLEELLYSPVKLTETELLIMTYRVFGFVLRSHKWAQLDLSLLRDDKNAGTSFANTFETLELPDNHRELLTSLVVQHFRSKHSTSTQNDVVREKSKGLVLLLHGVPGVGETSTVEGIAQLFNRPLIHNTCGALGTTALEVEEELEKYFSLATRWGCILLLDEADVFLSARGETDFKHNGLVAIFLRLIEYYSGVLFLITNKTGSFDEAFSSRIHMSLHYPPLDEERTWKVFQRNLERIKEQLEAQGRNITFDASAIQKFAREHFRVHKYNRWNGRQIRNACQTALELADFDSQGGSLDINGEINKQAVVQLQLKYFETVQKAELAFGEYLGDSPGIRGDSRAIGYDLGARGVVPYQQDQNASSQHESSRSGRGQRSVYPDYPHVQRSLSNIPESNFGSQGDQFSQNYAPATPNTNTARSQGYETYSSYPASMHSSQGQSRGASMANRDPYDRSSEGGQQYHSDQRFSQGGARGQRFDSPRMSDRAIPSVEDGRYSSPGYDNSPRPHRPAQRQSQTYGFDDLNDGDIAQSRNPPMQGPSSYNPNTIFRTRRDDIGN